MATTEMKKMTVMAGADFKFYSATKMQKGMRMPSEQHQMQSIPWMSLMGPVMQQLQKNRFLAGHISCILGIEGFTIGSYK